MRCQSRHVRIPHGGADARSLLDERMDICHVVPNLEPGEDGLGDYAWQLAKSLESLGFKNRFVVCGYANRHAQKLEPPTERTAFNIAMAREGDRESLAQALGTRASSVSLLHYANFGYAANGVPNWLADVAAAHRKSSFVTMFHETWQSPSLRQNRLYKWIFQKSCTLQIFSSSAGFCTNTAPRFENFQNRDAVKPGFWSPVFSNIGERVTASAKDEGLAVVFGLARNRQRCYLHLANQPDFLNTLGVTRILDIGEGQIDIPARLGAITRFVGRLEPAEVSEILTKAEFGFIDYNPQVIGKSGVFAAYASHRVCVVNLDLSDRQAEVSLKKCFVPFRMQANHDPGIVSDEAYRWYSDHNVKATAERWGDLLHRILLG